MRFFRTHQPETLGGSAFWRTASTPIVPVGPALNKADLQPGQIDPGKRGVPGLPRLDRQRTGEGTGGDDFARLQHVMIGLVREHIG